MNHKPNLTLVDKTLRIRRPIATVFEFISNHENYIRWFPGALAIVSADGLPHGTVGKIYHETLSLPTGRDRTILIEVLESQAPHLFIMEANFAPLHPRTEIRLTAESADETTLNWRFASRSQSPIMRFLLRTIIKKMVARQFEAGLLELKKILETDGP